MCIRDRIDLAEAGDIANGRIRQLYQSYQNRLIALNAVDFGDLLLHMLTIFTKHHDVLADYQARITHIMVDEYQDTNVAQYLWLRLLTGNRNNLCCVGDDDQSIYGWRGAEVGNILRFESDFFRRQDGQARGKLPVYRPYIGGGIKCHFTQ